MIGGERWARVQELFEAAADLAPAEQQAFLARECGGDGPLRQEVESLLRSDVEAGTFIEKAIRRGSDLLLAEKPDELEAIGKIGKYEILGRIGEGGFGIVYKGRDPVLQRYVAVKTCSSSNEKLRRRFFREGQIAAALQHPNITTVHDLGVERGIPYLVQEFLEGEDLHHKIGRREPLTALQRLDILVQVARGLEYAHAQGVLHRDIKPANIRSLPAGGVKIMDFGIAKLLHEVSDVTTQGVTLGTVGYLAPEQLRGDEVNQRTDIFSFGVLIYELMSYERPFKGSTFSEVSYRLLNEEPQALASLAPTCGAAIADLASRCLAKDPALRPASFGVVVAAIEPEIEALRSGAFLVAGAAATSGAVAAAQAAGSAAIAGGNGPVAPAAPVGPAASRAGAPVSGAVAAPAPATPADGHAEQPAPTVATAVPGFHRPTRSGRSAVDLALAQPGAAEAAAASPASRRAAGDDRVDAAIAGAARGGRRGRRAVIGTAVAAAAILAVAMGGSGWRLWRRGPAPVPAASAAGGAGQVADRPGGGGTDPSGTVGAGPQPGGGAGTAEPPGTAARSGPPGSPGAGGAPVQPGTTPGGPAPAGARPVAAGQASTAAAPVPARPAPVVPGAAAAPRMESLPQGGHALLPSVLAPQAGSSRPPAAAAQPVGADRVAGGASAPRGANTAAGDGADSASNSLPFERLAGLAGPAPPMRSGGADGGAPPPPANPAAGTAPGPGAETAARAAASPDAGVHGGMGGAGSAAGATDGAAAHRPMARGDLIEPGAPGAVPPRLVSRPEPTYPDRARRRQVEAEVLILVLVDETGHVIQTIVKKTDDPGSLGFNVAARQAAMQAQFNPATRDGIPGKMWTELPFTFRLHQ